MVAELDALEVLRAFVEAHAKPDPRTGGREAIWYFRHSGGGTLQHHGFDGPPPDVDEALLEDMAGYGFVDIDYGSAQDWKLTPTPEGRKVVEQKKRIENVEPTADISGMAGAVAAQAEADNKLGWPVVRPGTAGDPPLLGGQRIFSAWRAGARLDERAT